MEQVPQPRSAESLADFQAITRRVLETVSANQTGLLGGEIISRVHGAIGYTPPAVAAVFEEMADLGVIERSMSDPQAGIVLTEVGEAFLARFDEAVQEG